jgi:hypothetical protein
VAAQAVGSTPAGPAGRDRPPATRDRVLVASVVGIDGCGKSSTFRGALELLSSRIRVVGIGDEILCGGPGRPLAERRDLPPRGLARWSGRAAKRTRWQRLYKNLKFVDLTERARICEYVAEHDAPEAILTDGHPLVNAAAWSAARFFRRELAEDDAVRELLGYLTGERHIPLRRVPAIFVHSWQLVLLSCLPLPRYRPPRMVFLLDLPPGLAVARIQRRGKPLQSHETAEALADLRQAYGRVCRILQQDAGVRMTTFAVDAMPLAEVAKRVADGVLALAPIPSEAEP